MDKSDDRSKAVERERIRTRIAESDLKDLVKTYRFQKSDVSRASKMDDIFDLVTNLIIEAKEPSHNVRS